MAERQQFNVFLDRDLVRALRLHCVRHDKRLNHYVEELFAAALAADGAPSASSPDLKPTAPPMNASTLPRLATTIICVDDMARSLHLYRDLLGLRCRLESNRWSEFDLGGPTLALHIQDTGGAANADGVVALCIEVADLDETVARARAGGYAVEGPDVMEGVGRLASLRDPDGVTISLRAPTSAKA